MFAGRVSAASPQPGPTSAPSPPYPGDHDTTRLLELFDAAAARPLTMAELQRDGVAMPGQALYELQLAGYRIGRVYGRDARQRRTLLGYRLDRSATRPTAPAASGTQEPAR